MDSNMSFFVANKGGKEKKYKGLVFLGPPGVGKGTQAKLISNARGYIHLSTGDILRKNVKKGTDIGLKAKEYMDKGELVPDSIILELIKLRLSQSDIKRKGFILDGFPRTIKQAEDLDNIVKNLSLSLDILFYFDIKLDAILFRITNRRVCSKCGAIYHLVNFPPKKEGVCDECGGKLIHRDDDKEDVVRNRYNVYMQNTYPILDYYKNKKIIIEEINANRGVKEIYKEILKVLD